MANYQYDSSSDDETLLDDYRGKNGIIFLVDFREEMFQIDKLINKTYFRQSMDFCKKTMLEIARSGKDNLVGVSLFGTDKSSVGVPQLLTNLVPLSSVSVDFIKTIDDIIVDCGDDLLQKHGRLLSSTGLNLVKILNSSLKQFLECSKKVYTKTLVIFTVDDNPFGQDVKSAHLARKQAKRLSFAAVDLVVVGLGPEFEPNNFYNELIALTRGEVDRDWAKVNRVKNIDNLDNTLLSLMSRLSRTNRDLVLGGGISIPVSLYQLFKEPKVKYKRKVVRRYDGSSDEEPSVKPSIPPVNVNANKNDGVNANKIDGGKPYNPKNDMVPLIGGKLINLKRGDLKNLEFPEIEAGLKLIGFMPSEDIPEYLSVVPPRIMLPNYFSEQGKSAFSCLLQVCQEEQLSMVCWYRYNRNFGLSLVVCRPMSEHSDSKGNICPSGFCIVTVPFSDDYNDPDNEKLNVEPSQRQMQAAVNIVKKLTVGYAFDIFHDFELQKSLAMVEALALDYDKVPFVTDDTLMDDESTDNRIADFIEAFNNCDYLGPDTSSIKKRPAEGTSFRATKNPKLSTLEGMIDTIREGKAELLTVAQLKNVLDSKGICFSASSKKPQLVQLASAKIK